MIFDVALAQDDYPVQPEASIEAHRVAAPEAPIAAFTDDVWPLDALPRTAGAIRTQLQFTKLSEPWASVARWLAYLWINFPTPVSIRDQASSRHVDFPAAQTIRQRAAQLRFLMDWLADQGVTEASEIDDEHVTDFVLAARSASASPAATNRRIEIFRHWQAQNQHLPEALRLPTELRVDLPAEPRRPQRPENATRRVRQATMGPLLWWATRLVDEYCDLVFTLMDHVSAPLATPDSAQSKADQVRHIFNRYLAAGEPLPTRSGSSGDMAGTYLSWVHGTDPGVAAVIYSTEYAGRLAVARIADCPIIGLNGDLPAEFEPFLQFYDASESDKRWPRLARVLQAACLIVVTYLTGMRPDEVRRLRPGCCPEPVVLPGGGVRYLVHGTVTKRQGQADGLLAGSRNEVEAVWATIPAAARAIAVTERLRDRFAPESHWLFNSPFRKPMLDSPVATTEIQHFLTFINSRTERSTSAPLIPLDTHGPVTLRRFRRTLAWYIRNQPEGEVTLGVQYQHVGTVVGAGYAAAGSTGWADILDEEGLETRRHIAENLSRELLGGAGISGPAAARATYAVADYAAGVSLLPDNEMRRLLNAPGMQIYNNKASLSLCMFDPDRALCERAPRPDGRGADPNLLGCRAGCANRAMTDAHAELLAERVEQTRAQAEMSPQPMRNRLTQAADEMAERVHQHWQTRIVPTVPHDEEPM